MGADPADFRVGNECELGRLTVHVEAGSGVLSPHNPSVVNLAFEVLLSEPFCITIALVKAMVLSIGKGNPRTPLLRNDFRSETLGLGSHFGKTVSHLSFKTLLQQS